MLGADGPEVKIPRGPKEALADVVWDLVAASAMPVRADLGAWLLADAGARGRRR